CWCWPGRPERTPLTTPQPTSEPTVSNSNSPWPPLPASLQNDGVVDTEQDPRIERSRRVILEAALAELGEAGYGALTIESVAPRAGVGKSTIYRHWSGKLTLVEDAFRTL